MNENECVACKFYCERDCIIECCGIDFFFFFFFLVRRRNDLREGIVFFLFSLHLVRFMCCFLIVLFLLFYLFFSLALVLVLVLVLVLLLLLLLLHSMHVMLTCYSWLIDPLSM